MAWTWLAELAWMNGTVRLPFELSEVLSRLDRTFEAEPVNEIERARRPLVVLVLLIRPEDESSECVSVHTARQSVRRGNWR